MRVPPSSCSCSRTCEALPLRFRASAPSPQGQSDSLAPAAAVSAASASVLPPYMCIQAFQLLSPSSRCLSKPRVSAPGPYGHWSH